MPLLVHLIFCFSRYTLDVLYQNDPRTLEDLDSMTRHNSWQPIFQNDHSYRVCHWMTGQRCGSGISVHDSMSFDLTIRRGVCKGPCMKISPEVARKCLAARTGVFVKQDDEKCDRPLVVGVNHFWKKGTPLEEIEEKRMQPYSVKNTKQPCAWGRRRCLGTFFLHLHVKIHYFIRLSVKYHHHITPMLR